MYNNKGDREEAQIAVGFLRLPETTTTQKMVPKHHQYEYTIPDIKTIEATTHYYDNFRQVESMKLVEFSEINFSRKLPFCT